MLPSSQVNTNPFESIPRDRSRGSTPTPPSPNGSPNGSSSALSPRTPTFPPSDPLLTTAQPPDQSSSLPSRTHSHSLSSAFVSSPLNPNSTAPSPYAFVRPRPVSRSSVRLSRIASEDSQALGSQLSTSQRGSMVLWRLITTDESGVLLPPPSLSADQQRASVLSTASRDSTWTLSSDSKYPSGPPTTFRSGLVPYAWDPSVDEQDDTDEVDSLHAPDAVDKPISVFNPRSISNIGVLIILIGALLSLFIAYPILTYVRHNGTNFFLDQTGNAIDDAPQLAIHTRSLIDPDTPDAALHRTGFDGVDYDLVFSDEFNEDDRSFFAGDDPYWEAVDIWYWSTADIEWYDARQVYTKNGSLHIQIDNVAENGLAYRSGMLQSWNKFCFTGGYIEVSLTLPGPNDETRGYWPGAWTMGNLARAGFGATTDGVWPYSYDSCDTGTFPNQTWADGSGPAAALQSNASQAKYNYALSWLPGQRLSACTCPNADHPGPSNDKGRGAPEIDILEAEHDKQGPGGVVSQSAQFAPFAANYMYPNDTSDEWTVYNPNISRANNYRGSAVQQAISGLTELPSDVFSGGPEPNFHTFGFEYFANPQSRSDGFITWSMDNTPTIRMGASAIGPDQATDISQRLISEEPMAIYLNVAMSPNWQTIDLSTMIFPAEMLVDYVRVYQRVGNKNFGCDPDDHPTEAYINRNLDAYTNPQLKYWSTGAASANKPWPKNGNYSGGC
ncbi:beta-glucan synthesis-associated [Russula dissimulans]|nr:beta-glucan synthesis-associated [Russula dissimulans]